MARQTREGRRISDEMLDELLAGDDPAEVFRSGRLVDDLKKAVAERALDAEMDAHLEHEPSSGNHRNGHNRKRVLTDERARAIVKSGVRVVVHAAALRSSRTSMPSLNRTPSMTLARCRKPRSRRQDFSAHRPIL